MHFNPHMKLKSVVAGVCFSVLLAAATALAADAPAPAIIPLPQKLEPGTGSFVLTPATPIYFDSNSRATGKVLAEDLRPATGFPFKTSTKYFGSAARTGAIFLTTRDADTNLGPEGYELTVATDSIVIRAPAQAGLFYGVQTLLQLLPPAIFSTNVAAGADWQVPCVHIQDWPRSARGARAWALILPMTPPPLTARTAVTGAFTRRTIFATW